MFLPRTFLARRRFVTEGFRGVKRLSKRCCGTAVVKSPLEDIEISEQTVSQFMWSRSGGWEDLPAVTCGVSGRSYTYGSAKLLTEKFAKGLINKLPLEPGDRIGVLMPNLPEYLIVIHGCMEAGFVPTFANPLYTNEEIARQYLDAGVRCIVTISQLLDNALAVSAALRNYAFTVNANGPTDLDRKILGLEEVLQADNSAVKLPKLNPSDIASLPYSSGTTGLPKGVILTHENLTTNILQSSHPEVADPPKTTCLDDQEIALSIIPFFHIYGYNGILNFLGYHGAHVITMPRFNPNDYLTCIEKYRPTALFTVPSLVLFLATHPDVKPKHLQSIRQIICAAAPITPNVIEKLSERMNRPDFIFKQGYGMTEMSPTAIFTPRTMTTAKSGSVGRLVPSTEAKLIDLVDGGDVIGPNKSGELLIRGPQVMKGYLNNDAATKDTIDPDGWLHTGDVAYYDEDEYFYIVDRTKELIKVKGNQVSPTELEAILIDIPGVADCAVVGTPDDAAGELPRAFVVKAPGSTVTADDIKSHIKTKVAFYKRLEGGVKFIDAIPRNPSGKIMRHLLKSINA